MVSVPVLSNAIARVFAASSRNAPPFTRTPARAARLIALTSATGVEITSAHGHAVTSTTSARESQTLQASGSLDAPGHEHGDYADRSASATTTGV